MTPMDINPGFRLTQFKDEKWNIAYEAYRYAWATWPKMGLHTDDYPLNLDVETSNRCNLACPFCVREFMHEGVGDMKLEMFEKIITEVGDSVPAMKFNWRGEPTLNRHLASMISMAKKAGVVETMINTNGTLLNDSMSRALIRAGLDRMAISIDSIVPEVYKTQRVGAELPIVLENLRNFLKIRDEMGAERPYVRVQKVDLPESKGEDFVEFFRALGVDSAAVNTYKEKNASEVEWEPLQCAQPYQRLVITWRGDFYPCCQGHAFKKIGNIDTMTVHEAWQSPLMKSLRKNHYDGTQKEIPECRKCEVTKPLVVL